MGMMRKQEEVPKEESHIFGGGIFSSVKNTPKILDLGGSFQKGSSNPEVIQPGV